MNYRLTIEKYKKIFEAFFSKKNTDHLRVENEPLAAMKVLGQEEMFASFFSIKDNMIYFGRVNMAINGINIMDVDQVQKEHNKISLYVKGIKVMTFYVISDLTIEFLITYYDGTKSDPMYDISAIYINYKYTKQAGKYREKVNLMINDRPKIVERKFIRQSGTLIIDERQKIVETKNIMVESEDIDFYLNLFVKYFAQPYPIHLFLDKTKIKPLLLCVNRVYILNIVEIRVQYDRLFFYYSSDDSKRYLSIYYKYYKLFRIYTKFNIIYIEIDSKEEMIDETSCRVSDKNKILNSHSIYR